MSNFDKKRDSNDSITVKTVHVELWTIKKYFKFTLKQLEFCIIEKQPSLFD